ncbi:hypothetical protein KGF56_001278 [Candida oxycetoniae]|uniref:Programmed cell death protein 5 n=1 Tax=Candida oxycetoniae TaxID=497107 RepID=A0AAI9T0D1_9ASCO|nr:uncharacterized protein KGF56_001278 [Candida oxycetoniae]KAI3406059.2 hypothetical protein KGF56_001278 [Candida oxycetoniae]
MDDAELRAIREARMAELQKNAASGIGPGSSQQSQSSSQQQSAANDMAATILGRVLNNEARERLSRVRMVRPDRAQAVEEYIIKLYSMGQINGKLLEKDIVNILDGLSRDLQAKKQTKIVYNRKQLDDEDDDDFFD